MMRHSKRWVTATAVAVMATSLGLTVATPPASAAVVATSSGTTVTVTITGNDGVGFGCSAGNVRVNATVVSPAVACSALTKATVNGDGGNQSVYGATLNDASFVAGPTLTATLGDGSDYLTDTDGSDSFNMGAGNDTAEISPLSPNASSQMGPDTDLAGVTGTAADETYALTSGSTNATVSRSDGASAATVQVQNAEQFFIDSGSGDDTITTTGLTAASSIDSIVVYGRAGDDTLTNGSVDATLIGGPGANVMTGGSAGETFISASEADTIHAGGGFNRVTDTDSLRAGGRTIDATSPLNVHTLYQSGGDGVLRVRPAGAAGSFARITTSLTRPGQQLTPSSFSQETAYLGVSESAPDRSLVDVVTPSGPAFDAAMFVSGDGNDIADITVASGTWATSGTPATTFSVSPTDTTLMHVEVTSFADVSVHGPWTGDLNRGFAHRVVRDLDFRFLTPSELDDADSRLDAGTVTRAQFAAATMDTDEYRGLDVDRTFVKYLRRAADPGGRTYWINSIRNGKALWRFRAQLFGSNEYFTKAGGTNSAYVVKAYNDVLGRDPDPSGKAYWTNKLNGGADRGSVALQFINSPEARRRLVDDQFLRFLDRTPTPTEQTTWVAALPGTTGEQDLIRSLVSGSSYYHRS